MERERLYMMAIVPPPDLAEEIGKIREEFAEAYNCKAALKQPVHITLYPPYKEFDDHEAEVRKVLTKWVATQTSFDLEISGFDAFKDNGVVFLDVVKNDSLKQLHKGFSSQLTKLLQPKIKSNQSYHPHITIGYRDIPKEVFPKAVKDFLPRKFASSFRVDRVLFWRHNGKNWETIGSFPLNSIDKSEVQPLLF
jgi:2'-5' RNA ligase